MTARLTAAICRGALLGEIRDAGSRDGEIPQGHGGARPQARGSLSRDPLVAAAGAKEAELHWAEISKERRESTRAWIVLRRGGVRARRLAGTHEVQRVAGVTRTSSPVRSRRLTSRSASTAPGSAYKRSVRAARGVANSLCCVIASHPMAWEDYERVEGVDGWRFELPRDGAMPTAAYEEALDLLRGHLRARRANFLGFQANQSLEYAHLGDLLDMQINNLGGPFTNGSFGVNSKWIERAVLDYFADLWRAKAPWSQATTDAYWGYVLSMGSSEGNLYALWNAREYLSGLSVVGDDGARSPLGLVEARPREQGKEFSPVALCSSGTHYSIIKALRALAIPTPSQLPGDLPSAVPSHPDGDIDLRALEEIARPIVKAGHPILLILNYGTTFKGAYDDVAGAVAVIRRLYGKDFDRVVCDKNDNLVDRRTRAWFHVDGALGAAFAPYLRGTPYALPEFDFTCGVHSIVTSAHKWMGAPWPCGVYMTKRDYQLLPKAVDYIGSVDSTFSGSRNGLSSVLIWSYLARTGRAVNVKKAIAIQERAAAAHARLRALGEHFRSTGFDMRVARSPQSLTIRFRGLVDDLTRKYSLSSERIPEGSHHVPYSHVFVMEHFSLDVLDALIADVKSLGRAAFAEPKSLPHRPAPAPDLEIRARIPDAGRGFY